MKERSGERDELEGFVEESFYTVPDEDLDMMNPEEYMNLVEPGKQRKPSKHNPTNSEEN